MATKESKELEKAKKSVANTAIIFFATVTLLLGGFAFLLVFATSFGCGSFGGDCPSKLVTFSYFLPSVCTGVFTGYLAYKADSEKKIIKNLVPTSSHFRVS